MSDTNLLWLTRVEKIQNPCDYVEGALRRCSPKHIARTYNLSSYSSTSNFLEQLAWKSGRLLKGGEPDLESVAKMVLNDFLRGKLPWFTESPVIEGQETNDMGEPSRKGKRKRKKDGANEDESDKDEEVVI